MNTSALAMIVSTISDGHTDIADLCFLLATILGAIATVVLILERPLSTWRLCVTVAIALVSLGAFVL